MMKTFARALSTGASKPVFKSTWGEKPAAQGMGQLKTVMKNIQMNQEKVAENALQVPEISPRFLVQILKNTQYDPFDFTVAKRLLMQSHSAKRGSQPFGHEFQEGGLRKIPDVFQKTGINPLDLYLFGGILLNYVSESGRIYHRDVNVGLNKKTHKRLTKAIKRARAAGILSYTSRASCVSYAGVVGRTEELVQAYHDKYSNKEE